MEKQQIIKTGMDLLYLAECVLDGTDPDQTVTGSLNLELLYQMAESHHMTALAATALERVDFGTAQEETKKKFQESKQRSVRRAILYDAERAAILQEMEKKKIWYLPLKGCVLKDFYPGIGLREMADNDILFDATRKKDVRTIMVNRGFWVEKYGNSKNDDIYMKKPFYSFEMHKTLFWKFGRSGLNGYYDDIRSKICPDEKAPYGRHFSDEDFYLYFIAHAFKHYSDGGIGLRFLVDCRVYLEKKREQMDWNYIARECGKMGTTDFEEKSRRTALKIIENKGNFRNIPWTSEETDFLSELIRSGAYGNTVMRAEKKMEKVKGTDAEITRRTKVRYFFRRLFPTAERMKMDVPFIWRTKILIPFYFVFRIFRALICKRGMLRGDFKILERKEQ